MGGAAEIGGAETRDAETRGAEMRGAAETSDASRVKRAGMIKEEGL